jgi:Ser/Thr protein kinase RdoA (MazF antagonist)
MRQSWDMRERSARPLVVEAALALDFPVEELAPLRGATGLTWAAGDRVLRIGDGSRLDVEEKAMRAAAAQVPVPQVLDRVDLPTGKAALVLSLLPGHPAGDIQDLTEERAYTRGRACGGLHARLAEIKAPPQVPVEAVPVADRGTVNVLLHLDLHPFNVLVEDDQVSGVVDWANAAGGDPSLDRARSWTILTLDPAASTRGADRRWSALVKGWFEAAEFRSLPVTARGWACRYMMKDLSGRYRPDQLHKVRAALAECQRRLGEG